MHVLYCTPNYTSYEIYTIAFALQEGSEIHPQTEVKSEPACAAPTLASPPGADEPEYSQDAQPIFPAPSFEDTLVDEAPEFLDSAMLDEEPEPVPQLSEQAWAQAEAPTQATEDLGQGLPSSGQLALGDCPEAPNTACPEPAEPVEKPAENDCPATEKPAEDDEDDFLQRLSAAMPAVLSDHAIMQRLRRLFKPRMSGEYLPGITKDLLALWNDPDEGRDKVKFMFEKCAYSPDC